MGTRYAILQANRTAHQRLGSAGLAAAERIASRRNATDGSQDRGAERIRAGQATEVLEEASKLAANPEVREVIERADPEAIMDLDEEQQVEAEQRAESTALAPEVVIEPRTIETDVYEGAYPEFTKEDILEIHTQALLVLLPLEAALAPLSFTPASPIAAPLAGGVGGAIALVTFSTMLISRWED